MSISEGLSSLFGILCAYSFRTISTYRNPLGWFGLAPGIANPLTHLPQHASRPLYTIKACPLLPDIEALALPNQVISDVHAISANNHNYQYLGLNLEISQVSISSNNCSCRYFFTHESHTATLRSRNHAGWHRGLQIPLNTCPSTDAVYDD